MIRFEKIMGFSDRHSLSQRASIATTPSRLHDDRDHEAGGMGRNGSKAGLPGDRLASVAKMIPSPPPEAMAPTRMG